MNIRTAILKAADSIERNPHLFSFGSVAIPNKDCGTPGCAIGWIAYHRKGDVIFGRSWLPHKTIGISDVQFYKRMINIYDGHKWKFSADECASTLRKYADKYHPAQNTKQGIPESVLAIFNEKAVA